METLSLDIEISPTEVSLVKKYKDALRILLILYYFSDDLPHNPSSARRKVFYTEVKIQALDFLLRNPDYLCYELMFLAKENSALNRNAIKDIVREVFQNNEPEIRKHEMERFFYGAYENIDNTVAFLVSYNFIEHDSKRRVDGNVYEKEYYLTEFALNRIEGTLLGFPSVNWYISRINVIKNYFGSISGSDLKIKQYEISEYKNTSYRDHISSIEGKTKEVFFHLFQEEL